MANTNGRVGCAQSRVPIEVIVETIFRMNNDGVAITLRTRQGFGERCRLTRFLAAMTRSIGSRKPSHPQPLAIVGRSHLEFAFLKDRLMRKE